ncbi:GntR family transcriptional regulator, partial [Paenibacillus sp. TAF58]
MSRMRVSARTDERQPLYLQIQGYFKQLIQLGDMAENDKFPTEKQLMEQFGVSRMTVSNALTQLAKDGWIYRIPGRGSFVSPETRLEVSENLENEQLDLIDVIEPDEHASSRKMIGFV